LCTRMKSWPPFLNLNRRFEPSVRKIKTNHRTGASGWLQRLVRPGGYEQTL
jgi:hypothetical protein